MTPYRSLCRCLPDTRKETPAMPSDTEHAEWLVCPARHRLRRLSRRRARPERFNLASGGSKQGYHFLLDTEALR